jgi:hypothetical protein
MNTAETLVIVDPAAEDAMDQTSTARRLPGLAGMHIGMIDNSKHMADALLLAVEGLLKERHQVARATLLFQFCRVVETPRYARRHRAWCGRLRVVHSVGSPRHDRIGKAGSPDRDRDHYGI